MDKIMLFPDWSRKHRELKRAIQIMEDRIRTRFHRNTNPPETEHQEQCELYKQLPESEQCEALQHQIVELQQRLEETKGDVHITDHDRYLPEDTEQELRDKIKTWKDAYGGGGPRR